MPGKSRRTIDVASPGLRVAVFVDGCFWHGCPICGTSPHNNAPVVGGKLTAIWLRDQDATEHVHARGWTVIRLWGDSAAHQGASVVVAAVRTTRAGRTGGTVG